MLAIPRLIQLTLFGPFSKQRLGIILDRHLPLSFNVVGRNPPIIAHAPWGGALQQMVNEFLVAQQG